jgi:hypothetical protein
MMKILPIVFAVCFLLAVPAVFAAHDASVSFSPSAWELGSETQVEVVLTNEKTSKSNIVKFELVVPTEANKAIYKVQNLVFVPSGWQYLGTVVDGELRVLTFTALGRGMPPGTSAKFVLQSVKAPETVRETIWTWKTTDEAGDTDADSFVTTATLGKLTKFSFSSVPQKVNLGETFTITVSAIETHNLVKTDYTGKVQFSSTDRQAIFTPAEYRFVKADNGSVKVTVQFKTLGEHTITVTDATAKVSSTSDKIVVVAPVPTELSISINAGAAFTTTQAVTLTISAKNAEECRYSNDKLFWTNYMPYTTSLAWQLPAGDGIKTVYMQCRNSHGESEIVSDSIELRTTLPPTGLLAGISVSNIISGLALMISIIALIIAFSGKPRKKAE